MASMNLEAWGPRPVSLRHSTPHSIPHILFPQRRYESSVNTANHRPKYSTPASRFYRHKLASSSSSLEILDVISTTPLAAMDPETSHHAATSEVTGNSARSSDTESAIPETSGGSWDPCNLNKEVLSSLEQEGLIAARENLKMAS
jgi:hypothetical protein